MIRTVACALVALVLFVGGTMAADKPAKNQMVKGTVKVVDPANNTLIVNQKVGTEVVDRELNIQDVTEFSVTDKDGKEETATGKAGLKLLVGKEGASIQVKCDKDVNVLKVTVKASK